MTNQGPLAGVTIVDMTSVLFGPYATQIMGDLGAEVIKIEAPEGDILRWAGKSPHPDCGPIYITVNRNKQSIALDLRQDEAKDALKKILKDANVFITNVRGGGLERLGFDYEGVRAVNDSIIYVHCVGFGSGGAYAGRMAYDDLVQAGCGITALQSHVDGDPTPRMVPALIADKTTGLHAAYATIAALYHQQKTGEGQFVEVPMLESMVSFTLAEHFYGHVWEEPKGQWTYTRITSPNRKPYQTSDGYLGIMPYSDKHWADFFDLGGRPDLWDQWRNTDYAGRTEHIDALYALIAEVALTKTTNEWMELLEKAGIPAMRVNRLEDLQDDPHLKSVDFFQLVDHPTEGKYWAMKHPVHFSKTPASLRRHAPRLGADARGVLKDAGFSDAEIEDLLAKKAVSPPPQD